MENLSARTVTVEMLGEKEVINIIDGKRLGYPCDVQMDLECGRITAIILPPGGGFLGIGHKHDKLVIPWENIEKIGKDIILVKCIPIPKKEKCDDEECKKRFFN